MPCPDILPHQLLARAKQLMIYMPRSLATDSAFPFKPKEMVRISISGKMLTVEKAELPYNETDTYEEQNAV